MLMHIEHLAIWTYHLEELRRFYTEFLGATSSLQYHNPVKSFKSYFLSFDSGCRLEIMEMPGIADHDNDGLTQATGLTHFAIDLGSRGEVDRLTAMLRAKGTRVVGEPRITGDGYYESVVLDPDGNRIELLSH